MTEQNIPADAEGLSNFIKPTQQEVSTALTVCSLLHICRVAAHFIEEDDGYPTKDTPSELAKVLKHTEKLAIDVAVALGRASQGGVA